MASVYDSYTLAGMEAAKGLLSKAPSAYPTYTPSQAVSPTKMDYYSYTPTAPMSQLQAPNYTIKAAPAQQWQSFKPSSGLLQGDYEAYQRALEAPGAAAATSAYNQGTLNLADTMGGRGLYGSSVMQNHQREALDKVYQQNLANNASQAAVSRYGMQNANINEMNGLMAQQNTAANAYAQSARAQDIGLENQLNQFNAQNYVAGIGQNKDIATINMANAENQNTYAYNKSLWDQQQAEAQRAWQNQSGYEKMLYEQAKNAYQNQSDEALYNRALALGGLGNTSSTAASNYQLASQQLAAQQAAAQQANTASLIGSSLNFTSTAGLLGGKAMGWF